MPVTPLSSLRRLLHPTGDPMAPLPFLPLRPWIIKSLRIQVSLTLTLAFFSSHLQSRAYKVAVGKNWVKELTELCVCELVFACVRNSSKLRKTETEKREAKSYRGCGNSRAKYFLELFLFLRISLFVCL